MSTPSPTSVHRQCGYRRNVLGHLGPCEGKWPAPPPPPALDGDLASQVHAGTDHATKVYDLAVRSWARRAGFKVTPRLSNALKAEFDHAHPAPALADVS
jgi:hypothetical protein